MGFSKLTEDLRLSKTDLLGKHHAYIHGDSKNSTTPGFEEGDSFPENYAEFKKTMSKNPNLNKMDDSGCKLTLPLLMWTNEQLALLTLSPNWVLLSSYFGTGEKL